MALLEIVLDKRPPNLPRVPRVPDPHGEGRVFCHAPDCPLCRPEARFARFIRIARLPARVFRLLQEDPESASAFIRRLLLEELHRPQSATRRDARPYAPPGPAGIPGKSVRVTEAVYQELKRRGLKIASFVSGAVVREFGALEPFSENAPRDRWHSADPRGPRSVFVRCKGFIALRRTAPPADVGEARTRFFEMRKYRVGLFAHEGAKLAWPAVTYTSHIKKRARARASRA